MEVIQSYSRFLCHWPILHDIKNHTSTYICKYSISLNVCWPPPYCIYPDGRGEDTVNSVLDIETTFTWWCRVSEVLDEDIICQEIDTISLRGFGTAISGARANEFMCSPIIRWFWSSSRLFRSLSLSTKGQMPLQSRMVESNLECTSGLYPNWYDFLLAQE